MDVQMKSCVFKRSDPISVLIFLEKFKSACITNSIHEGASKWMFPYFFNKPAKAALSYRKTTQNLGQTHFEDKLTTYCQVVNYMLKTYAADDIGAKREADINRFKQAAGMSVVRFSKLLCKKAPRCRQIYEKSTLKRIFIKGLQKSNRLSMWTYWIQYKETSHWQMAGHATNLLQLQADSITPNSTTTNRTYHRRQRHISPRRTVKTSAMMVINRSATRHSSPSSLESSRKRALACFPKRKGSCNWKV